MIDSLNSKDIMYSRVESVHGWKVFTGIMCSVVDCVHGYNVFGGGLCSRVRGLGAN